ncbi:hypothetical protein GNI_018310 [Gregarina niphandrodes]|uniref:DUF6827 domain-containing protein n=1 Tax=Gregarina niphandrodes TaxID=110365 RepID=A0A023BC66_GRENI|nr:hypothetical protein GNI_018310 [Gregarina niphandrodes]EZG81689.1 hypothetical protein GNI_018310 [Gregarina niphandrodes]|eukprot:XP_011134195.1 hypothetical protein GNI_018310 [Gregarina niphandrodes]
MRPTKFQDDDEATEMQHKHRPKAGANKGDSYTVYDQEKRPGNKRRMLSRFFMIIIDCNMIVHDETIYVSLGSLDLFWPLFWPGYKEGFVFIRGHASEYIPSAIEDSCHEVDICGVEKQLGRHKRLSDDIAVDLEKAAEHCPEFGRSKEWGKTQRVLDLMFQCEDVRDYINEILEALDRLNPREMGVMTVRRTPSEMDKRIEVILSRMSELQKNYPELNTKIDESVGKGTICSFSAAGLTRQVNCCKSAFVLDPDTLDPDTLDPDTLNPDALDPDTLDPDTLDPDALDSDTLDPDTLDSDTLVFTLISFT